MTSKQQGARFVGVVPTADQEEQAGPATDEACEFPYHFEIGAAVRCDDGRCGRLARVVIDPATDRVTSLIVEKGFLQKEDRVLPVSVVKAVTDDEILVGFHSSMLSGYTEYKEVEFRAPVEGWDNGRYQPEHTRYAMSPYEGVIGSSVAPTRKYRLHEGVPFDLKVVGHGTKVYDAGGSFGEVDHVLVDCDGQHISHMVVRHGLFAEYVIVPVAMILSVDDESLTLGASREELRSLPRYNRN